MCLTVLPSIAPQFPGVFIHPSIFNIETWAFSVAARTLRNFLPVNALLNLCFQEFNHNRSCLIILNINHDTNSGVSRISQRGSQGEAGGGRGKPIHSCYHVVAQWKNTVKKKNIKPKGVMAQWSPKHVTGNRDDHLPIQCKCKICLQFCQSQVSPDMCPCPPRNLGLCHLSQGSPCGVPLCSVLSVRLKAGLSTCFWPNNKLCTCAWLNTGLSTCVWSKNRLSIHI